MEQIPSISNAQTRRSEKKRLERRNDNWLEDKGLGKKYGCCKVQRSSCGLQTTVERYVNNYLSSTY